MMLRMYPDNTWQCPHCKTCVICFETSDAVSILLLLVITGFLWIQAVKKKVY